MKRIPYSNTWDPFIISGKMLMWLLSNPENGDWFAFFLLSFLRHFLSSKWRPITKPLCHFRLSLRGLHISFSNEQNRFLAMPYFILFLHRQYFEEIPVCETKNMHKSDILRGILSHIRILRVLKALVQIFGHPTVVSLTLKIYLLSLHFSNFTS